MAQQSESEKKRKEEIERHFTMAQLPPSTRSESEKKPRKMWNDNHFKGKGRRLRFGWFPHPTWRQSAHYSCVGKLVLHLWK